MATGVSEVDRLNPSTYIQILSTETGVICMLLSIIIFRTNGDWWWRSNVNAVERSAS